MDTNSQNASQALDAFTRQLLEGIVRPLTESAGFDIAEMTRLLAAGLVQDHEHQVEIQKRYYDKQLALWASFFGSAAATDRAPVVSPEPTDRRFRGTEWRDPYFDYLVQMYLLRVQCLTELVDGADLDSRSKRKLTFFSRQMIDAMSPANFLWSNPEALKLAMETRGNSLARGMRNLDADMEKGIVSMSDESAFEVGRNLAITPGAVVFENDFMQLIQYRPATDTVYERPLVIVPPCINKYYILDLQPDNSFVRYIIGEGHTVFMVSWRNMPEAMGRATWDDYLAHGVIKAIDVVRAVCGVPRVNTLGFCIGGTLLGAALAVLRGQDRDPAESLTLLAAMLDFGDTGDLSVFVDEAYVRKCEHEFATGGLLHGRELALTFASLRANDLIWNYVVNNYLKGKTPEPFDLLYWNADSTNLPGVMYAYYVRNMYLENTLSRPGGLEMCGVPVDLARIDMPAYILATREDHIVPWQTAYASTRLLGGKMEFVLAASGHIAGVINPAARNRRSFWLNRRLPKDATNWLAAAVSHSGSWWRHWSSWLATYGGGRVPARNQLGGGPYNEIEPAPGRYVKKKCRETA